MVEKVHWGIIGTGDIAKKFAAGLSVLSDADLVSVASRARKTADAFGDLFHVRKRHDNYESLAQDPDVNVIYISTPHSLHKENTLMCLRAGKSVLCEKPFAINAEEAAEMIRLARERRLFLMEAMWTRFFPLMAKVREMILSNAIGEVRMLMADFGYRSEDLRNWVFDPNFGGGGLLDVGIYPLSFSHSIFGIPNQITSISHLGNSGVDEQSAVILGHEGGRMALLASATRTQTPQVAYLLGTKGQIHIHSPWWKPKTLTLSLNGRDEVMQIPFQGNGYNYEAAEVVSCLREGKTESDTMPLDETLSIMKTMDTIRAQWNLKYPME